jgi:hypothetical protein
MNPRSALVLSLFLGPLLGACDAATGQGLPAEAAGAITVGEPRLRITPGEVAAIYFRVTNASSRPDRLRAVTIPSDAAARIEMHETVVEEGVARMLERPEGYRIPAGGTLALEEGGRHLMLFGLHRGLEERGLLDLELDFERAGKIAVRIPAGVRDAEGESCCLEK